MGGFNARVGIIFISRLLLLVVVALLLHLMLVSIISVIIEVINKAFVTGSALLGCVCELHCFDIRAPNAA